VTAVLAPAAKDGGVAIVRVESQGYEDVSVTAPADVLLPSLPFTLKIVSLEGIVDLVGRYRVDYYGDKYEDDTEDEDGS